MNWLMETGVAALARWNELRAWRRNVHDRNEAFDASWLDEIRTPEDANIGPFDPVTRVPRPRRGRHRADPKEGAS